MSQQPIVLSSQGVRHCGVRCSAQSKEACDDHQKTGAVKQIVQRHLKTRRRTRGVGGLRLKFWKGSSTLWAPLSKHFGLPRAAGHQEEPRTGAFWRMKSGAHNILSALSFPARNETQSNSLLLDWPRLGLALGSAQMARGGGQRRRRCRWTRILNTTMRRRAFVFLIFYRSGVQARSVHAQVQKLEKTRMQPSEP